MTPAALFSLPDKKQTHSLNFTQGTQLLLAWMDNLSEPLAPKLDSFSSVCNTVLFTFENYSFWVVSVSSIMYPAGSCPRIPWDDKRFHRHRPEAAPPPYGSGLYPVTVVAFAWAIYSTLFLFSIDFSPELQIFIFRLLDLSSWRSHRFLKRRFCSFCCGPPSVNGIIFLPDLEARCQKDLHSVLSSLSTTQWY